MRRPAEFPILLGAPRDVLRRCNLMLVLYHADLAAGSMPARLDEHLRSGDFSTSVHRQTMRGAGSSHAATPELSGNAPP